MVELCSFPANIAPFRAAGPAEIPLSSEEVPVRSFLIRSPRWAIALPVLTVLGLALAGLPAPAQDAPKYHDQAALSSALQALAAANKPAAKLASIGKSRGGRDIWVLEIANPGPIAPDKRPALLIAAGFEGDHLVGGEIALAVARALLEGRSSDAATKEGLNASTIYIVPRLNPDGAEGFFAAVKTGRRTNATPRDDDNDGRVDEDGPEDLNGDGLITVMRVKAAGGEYMVDPDEPRLMRRADRKKGETGAYRLYTEGIDNDGDGFINEDPPGGVDLNRNFTHEFPYNKPDAGPHMVSEAESRALMDWVLEHGNIAAILTFGESDNLIVPPTSAGRLGPGRELDLVRFAEAAAAGARTSGFIQTGGASGRGGRFMGGEFPIEMLMGGGGGGRQGSRQQAQAQPAAPGGRMMMPDRRAATTVATADYDYFKAVSDKYIELTGLRQPLYVREPQGAFFQYGYFQFGVPSFSTPGFGLATAESPGGRRMGMMPPGGGEAGPAGPGGQSGQAGRQGGQTGSGATQVVVQGGGGQEIAQMMQMGGGGGGQAFRFAQGQTGAPAEAGQALTPGIDRQVLRWLDAEKIDGFVKWTAVKHPEFGEVEVGGFKPYAVTNPPAAKLAELGASHAKFAVYLASLFPRIKVASFEAVALGGGIHRLKAEIENAGFWPTSLVQGQTARAVKPTMVQLGVDPGNVLSGSAKTNFLPTLAGSGSRAKYEWLIRGKAGETVEVLVRSEKGGSATARVILK
ncbi:MAG TPA: M14 family metallopeptidase [Acidobacteriota bacterium]|nr:M14 family metallopeptidase [Acidobacteriota bacterium]